MSDNPAEILKIWLAAINSHDVPGLRAIMATDFVFVDSLANRIAGADRMKEGWTAYFAMCPDYWIRVNDAMSQSETMLMAGEAGGTIDGESWKIPAAWKAVFRDGRIVEWHVFADNKPVYEILARRRVKG